MYFLLPPIVSNINVMDEQHPYEGTKVVSCACFKKVALCLLCLCFMHSFLFKYTAAYNYMHIL
jgi:hypothetical protein